MTKFTFAPIGVTLLFAMTILAGSGCTSLTSKMSLPTWGGTSSPTEIVAFWDTIIRTEGDKAERGFAARVMFFDSSNGKKALRVRGNFDVYIFDEEATGKAATTPVKIVRYQMGDLKALESDSKMFGKSYTLWVPWDELNADSEERKLSLFVRFKCDDGTMVLSKQATVSLPASPEKMAEKAEVEYENPHMENRLRQLAELTASAERRKSNSNSFETEWNGTVAEFQISNSDRPTMMATRTFTVPGVSRDGSVPTIKPEYHYASATDEQKHLAKLMIANAQVVQSQQQANAGVFNQVQYQSQGNNEASLQQPTFQPAQGLAPMNEEAMYREYLYWQQHQGTQKPIPQQPIANYAAANTGTTLR
jgi:hypothetical protein